MRIIDTSDMMLSSFDAGFFNMDKWKIYIEGAFPGIGKICAKDMQECIDAGFSWGNDYLLVLNAVYNEEEKRIKVINSFHAVTNRLNERNEMLLAFNR